MTASVAVSVSYSTLAAMDNASPLVNSEAYTVERKDEDFARLRQAAMERADASSRHPVVALPGAVINRGHAAVCNKVVHSVPSCYGCISNSCPVPQTV